MNSQKTIPLERRLRKAFSLVEVMIAMTLFAIFTTSVVFLSLSTLERDTRQKVRQEALFYAIEGLEAVRSMRDRDFLLLSNGDHGLAFTSDQWTFIAAPETIDNFYDRTLTIEDVYRDDLGEIDESGSGTFDPETVQVTVDIEWLWRGVMPQSISMTSYLTNWTGDDWLTTSCDDWEAGTNEDVNIVTTGELESGEQDCSVELTITETQSDFYATTDVGKHGNDVDVEGDYAYLAVDDSTNGLAIIDVSDPASPTIESQLYLWNKGRSVAHDGTRLYMGIKSSSIGIAIVDVANPAAPSALYAWNTGGYGNHTTVASQGDYFYMGVETTGNAFLVYKISPVPTLTDFLDFNDEVQVVELNGSYAYLGCESDSVGFRVINIADPYNISQVATLDVEEEVNAIEISGAIAYVGTDEDDESLVLVDISNPASPTVVGSLDVGGEIEDLVVLGDYLYAAIDKENQGFAAIDITDPLNPEVIYTRDINGKGTGIDAQGDYVYMSTDTHNQGLVILGTIIEGVQASGTYTSTVLDTGSDDTRYNFIEWDHTEVAGGTVQFQIRTADTSTNLSSATWVGSDGTSSTYYTTSRTEITLDPLRSGQRYFQFKAFLESNGVTSPLIDSVRVNYNP